MTRILVPCSGTTPLAMPAAADTTAVKNRFVAYVAHTRNTPCVERMRLVVQCYGFVGGYYGAGTLLVRCAGEQLLHSWAGSDAGFTESDSCVVGSRYLRSVPGNGCLIQVDVLQALRDGAGASTVVEISGGGYYSYYGCGTPNQAAVSWGWGRDDGGFTALATNLLANCTQDTACGQAARWNVTVTADGRIL